MPWSDPIQFLVDGDPAPKRIARAGVSIYTGYDRRVRRAIPGHLEAIEGTMCRVTLDMVFRRPQRRPPHIPEAMWAAGLCWHVGSIDVDNVIKAALDGLCSRHPETGDRYLSDDRWIVEVAARKRCGPRPHVIVAIQTWVDHVDDPG